MLLIRDFRILHLVAIILTIFGSTATAADKDSDQKEIKVAGIIIAKQGNTLTVKVDGDEEPTQYVLGAEPDKKVAESLKGIFDASRVQITYKTVGDTRQLITIKKQVLKTAGTVTGTVEKVYNDFWVEVKPKNGLADAYAPNVANFKNKDFMEKLKGLKKGDTVTIKFTTDFERHRIESLRKHDNPQS